MTKIFRGSGLVAVTLMVSSFIPNPVLADQKTDFVNQCTKTPKVMASQIFCHMESDTADGEIQFLMTQGKTIQISGTGRYASLHKILKVSDVRPLEPRLSDVGAVDASVRFLARSGRTVVTMDIPCGQAFYAAVGLGENQAGDQLPGEWSAECSVQ